MKFDSNELDSFKKLPELKKGINLQDLALIRASQQLNEANFTYLTKINALTLDESTKKEKPSQDEPAAEEKPDQLLSGVFTSLFNQSASITTRLSKMFTNLVYAQEPHSKELIAQLYDLDKRLSVLAEKVDGLGYYDPIAPDYLEKKDQALQAPQQKLTDLKLNDAIASLAKVMPSKLPEKTQTKSPASSPRSVARNI